MLVATVYGNRHPDRSAAFAERPSTTCSQTAGLASTCTRACSEVLLPRCPPASCTGRRWCTHGLGSKQKRLPFPLSYLGFHVGWFYMQTKTLQPPRNNYENGNVLLELSPQHRHKIRAEVQSPGNK